MKICVMGVGYVGLVTGTCFAEMGNDVTCVDIDAQKIASLKKNQIPIYEPGLEELVRRNQQEERLHFSTEIAEGIKNSLFIFIAVGTPPGKDGAADISQVLSVARAVGRYMDGYRIVVDKSTVPVGTADQVREAIAAELKLRGMAVEFDMVSNPEFLKEGAAVEDFMKPDRIVVGVDNVRTAELVKELYAPFVRTNRPILIMDIRSAEMTKYAANAMLASRISFMNEMSNLCERLGADISQVRQGIGFDARIGQQFLFPGVGYGGSCFPKDVQALIRKAHEVGYPPRLMEAVEQVNYEQKLVLVKKITAHFGEDLTDKVFALWGLAFKPQTDDMREAPAIVIITELIKRGARIQAYDPKAMDVARRIFGLEPRLSYHKNNYEAAAGADALALVTEWTVFREPDFPRLKQILRQPIIFDGRNQYNHLRMEEMGFKYYCIGRK